MNNDLTDMNIDSLNDAIKFLGINNIQLAELAENTNYNNSIKNIVLHQLRIRREQGGSNKAFQMFVNVEILKAYC